MITATDSGMEGLTIRTDIEGEAFRPATCRAGVSAGRICIWLKSVVVWHDLIYLVVPGVPFVPSVPASGTAGQFGTGSGV